MTRFFYCAAHNLVWGEPSWCVKCACITPHTKVPAMNEHHHGERTQSTPSIHLRPPTLLLSDSPVGFLGSYVGRDGYQACVRDDGYEPFFGEYDGFAADLWIETFFSTESPADRQSDGRWREVHVDVGSALNWGQWSGKVDVKIYARSELTYDLNNTLLVGCVVPWGNC